MGQTGMYKQTTNICGGVGHNSGPHKLDHQTEYDKLVYDGLDKKHRARQHYGGDHNNAFTSTGELDPVFASLETKQHDRRDRREEQRIL